MPNHVSQDDKARIMSGQARGGNDMSSSGFAARAQSAADRHTSQQGGNSGNNNPTGNNQASGSSKSGRK